MRPFLDLSFFLLRKLPAVLRLADQAARSACNVTRSSQRCLPCLIEALGRALCVAYHVPGRVPEQRPGNPGLLGA